MLRWPKWTVDLDKKLTNKGSPSIESYRWTVASDATADVCLRERNDSEDARGYSERAELNWPGALALTNTDLKGLSGS